MASDFGMYSFGADRVAGTSIVGASSVWQTASAREGRALTYIRGTGLGNPAARPTGIAGGGDPNGTALKYVLAARIGWVVKPMLAGGVAKTSGLVSDERACAGACTGITNDPLSGNDVLAGRTNDPLLGGGDLGLFGPQLRPGRTCGGGAGGDRVMEDSRWRARVLVVVGMGDQDLVRHNEGAVCGT